MADPGSLLYRVGQPISLANDKTIGRKHLNSRHGKPVEAFRLRLTTFHNLAVRSFQPADKQPLRRTARSKNPSQTGPHPDVPSRSPDDIAELLSF